MEKKAPQFLLNKAVIRTRRMTVHSDPECAECGFILTKGLQYVQKDSHTQYCVPCAKKLSKSIRTCFKKHKYLSPADAISRARTVVKSQGVYQLPYNCPHCEKYHLTTVEKRTVPKQLLRIYQTDVLGPPVTQAIDRYLLEYEI